MVIGGDRSSRRLDPVADQATIGSILPPGAVEAIVLVVGLLALLAGALPWRHRPIGVRSDGHRTVIRASSWVVGPPVFVTTAVWVGREHLPHSRGMVILLAAMAIGALLAIRLAWRNCRVEFANDRTVTRASWTGRRIVHARPAGTVQRRLYVAESGMLPRPTGLFLDGSYVPGGRPADARPLAAMAGLVRANTWAYRALREVARAGNWPANTRLELYERPSRGQRAIIADIAACGVEVDDRSEEFHWRRRRRRVGRHSAR